MVTLELDPIDLTLDALQDPHRPVGLHQSDIINDMVKRLDPKRYDKRDPKTGEPVPMDVQKIDAGLKTEQAIERALRDVVLPGVFRPAPIQVDGIWMSPDGIDAAEWMVVEYKLTWYSGNKICPDHEVFWPWLVQIQGYCYGLQTTEALLIPQFINGDYAPPRPWKPRRIRLSFTKLELEENWFRIVNHAKSLGWL